MSSTDSLSVRAAPRSPAAFFVSKPWVTASSNSCSSNSRRSSGKLCTTPLWSMSMRARQASVWPWARTGLPIRCEATSGAMVLPIRAARRSSIERGSRCPAATAASRSWVAKASSRAASRWSWLTRPISARDTALRSTTRTWCSPRYTTSLPCARASRVMLCNCWRLPTVRMSTVDLSGRCAPAWATAKSGVGAVLGRGGDGGLI